MRINCSVGDVVGQSVRNATVHLQHWSGGDNISTEGDQTLTADTIELLVPDNCLSVTIEVRHVNFASSIISIHRHANSAAWQWDGSARSVVSEGRDLRVEAVLKRLRPVPSYVAAPDINTEAGKVKAAFDERWERTHPKSKPPPFFTRFRPERAVLLNEQREPRYQHFMGRLDRFHQLQPGLIGDSSHGWGLYDTRLTRPDLSRDLFYLFEYGEVGAGGLNAPRFLVAAYCPRTALAATSDSLDFLVWFSPNTTPANYPGDKWPYNGDYPYCLWAGGSKSNYFAVQRYVQLPLHHSHFYHYLAYHLAASQRDAVLVILAPPAAPDHRAFELLVKQSALMRMLKEIAWYLTTSRPLAPLRPAQSLPSGKVVDSRKVRYVVTAGFSAGAARLGDLMFGTGTPDGFVGPNWIDPIGSFDQVWKEVWAMDYAGRKVEQRTAFLNHLAEWRERKDRRFRVYQSAYPYGRWDPRNEPRDTLFGRLLRSAKVTETDGKVRPWAALFQAPDQSWTVASFSEAFVMAPRLSDDYPSLKELKAAPGEDGQHEAVPRLFLGHACELSGFARH